MKSFKYIARDMKGNSQKGVHQAENTQDVLGWLSGNNLTPISVNELNAKSKRKARAKKGKKIKSSDISAIFWQLTTMVEGGITITESLEIVSGDIENPAFKAVLVDMLENINRGETFSDCMAAYPKLFNNLACAIILAGETGGNMAESLRKLAIYYENKDKLAKKVKGAMAYPIFVLVFIVVIVVFLMAFIVPRFEVMFETFGSQLPAFTRGFMAVYEWLKHNVFYLAGGFVGIFMTLSYIYTKTKSGHIFFSKNFLKLPLIGRIISQVFYVTFCRTMSTLMASGVSVLEVFEILSTMSPNDVIQDAIAKSKKEIIEGSGISAGLLSSGFFPNLVVKMVQVGEESGSMPKVLERTADYYERKVDASIDLLMALLEPIMIVSVGSIVLVVVLALYLPIFSR